MRKRLLVIFALVSSMALMTVGAAAQQQGPSGQGGQQQADWAVVQLQESDGSGFQGMAVLREEAGAGQTEVVVAVTAGGGGFLGLFGSDAESLGSVAILSGTCDEPGSMVENLGQLTALNQGQEQQEGSEVHAAAATVSMGLNEVLSGQYVIAVLEQGQAGATPGATPGLPGASPTPGLEGQQQQEINALACGELSMDAQIEPTTPTPGTPGLPGATPSPTPSF